MTKRKAEQPLFVGHSELLAALCGYDTKSPLFGKPRSYEYMPYNSRLKSESGIFGGFVEVLVPPIIPPAITRSHDSVRVTHPDSLDQQYALAHVVSDLGYLKKNIKRLNGTVSLATRVRDIENCVSSESLALVLHLADADCVSQNLDELYTLHAVGVRSMAVTWSRSNCFGYGPPYEIPGNPNVGPGLTSAGKDFVRLCNQLGMLVDLAHLNEAGFWDVEATSTHPLIITGGSLQSLTPSSRSTTDRQLDAIAASGGLIAISTESLRPSEKGVVAEAISQILYVIERVGIDHVAIGSDLFQRETKVHAYGNELPVLLAGLANAGLDNASMMQIGWKNWCRVLEQVWQ